MKKREYAIEKFTEAMNTANDPQKTTQEAIRDTAKLISQEFVMANDLNQARQIRKEAVGKRLNFLREEKGVKQKEVATKIGINAITLSGYEIAKSEPNFEVLVRLADYYQVSLDYILCRTDTKIEFDKEAFEARDEERQKMKTRLETLEKELLDIKNGIK